ncbi:hypothetical protein CB1_000463003 [Camelus ferus]|nr:hypothetical protein CB1_000463003 [Camelus ferus]
MSGCLPANKKMVQEEGFGVTVPDTTTYSTERSEHFKPCRDKDLAYCLNDGECFVIETLTGSHKHCRSLALIPPLRYVLHSYESSVVMSEQDFLHTHEALVTLLDMLINFY